MSIVMLVSFLSWTIFFDESTYSAQLSSSIYSVSLHSTDPWNIYENPAVSLAGEYVQCEMDIGWKQIYKSEI